MQLFKIFCFGFLLILSQRAFSQESPTYEMRNLEINVLSEALSLMGWMEFADAAKIPVGSLRFDQAYVRHDSDELVLVKIAGPSTKSIFEKIPTHDGLIFNFTTRWGNLASLYIQSSDPSRIAQIQRSISSRQFSRWELFLPKAYALGSKDNCTMRSSNSSWELGSTVTSCFWSAFGGLKKDLSAKGSQIWDAIKNPKSLKEYWEDGKNQFKAIETTIAEINKTVPAFIEIVRHLKPSLQAEALCAWVGSLAPDMLMTLLAGAGVAKLGLKLIESLEKMKNLKNTLEKLKKFESLIPEKAQKEFISGAIACGT